MDPSLSSISLAPPPPIPPPPIIPVVAIQKSSIAGGLPPSFNVPPYSDMICEAIGTLKEMNGSSKKAIDKYIESTYKDLPPTHSALLAHHLKSLKNSGVLVMVKNSYKLAPTVGSEASFFSVQGSEVSFPVSDTSSEPKRGRGRPPKPKPALPIPDSNSHQLPVSISDLPKRSPGRPRKSVPGVQVGAMKVRGRGRPPKSALKKSPGRPKKPKTVKSVVGANLMKRGRGRPPKALNQRPPPAAIQSNGHPVAVPYADADSAAATVTATATVGVPRPRGRPKGTARAAPYVRTGKPRGRPPKFGGVAAKPIKPMKTTGRPVGRPKKTTDGAELKVLAEGNGAELKALKAANGDLKRTLELFQSKVKQAVEVLKPQFSRESNSGAIGAIQELEGLVAMEINASSKVADAQPSPPPPPPPPPPAQPSPLPPAQPPVANDDRQVL